ncbi:MAG TPA: hypothetical protein VFN49_13725 [Candidatus Aquilonibacter sp.]|nr:hypothetical protein [Candidatus Aquilonibacter sp.]
MIRRGLFFVMLIAGLTACGAASVSAPQASPSPSGITNGWGFGLPDSGISIDVAHDTLTFSTNDAPAQTMITVSPMPLPTPKWPLPEAVAAYAVVGSFDPSRTYSLIVSDASGHALAQAPGAVTGSGVCSASASTAGDMQGHQTYSFTMMMSAAP